MLLLLWVGLGLRGADEALGTNCLRTVSTRRRGTEVYSTPVCLKSVLGTCPRVLIAADTRLHARRVANVARCASNTMVWQTDARPSPVPPANHGSPPDWQSETPATPGSPIGAARSRAAQIELEVPATLAGHLEHALGRLHWIEEVGDQDFFADGAFAQHVHQERTLSIHQVTDPRSHARLLALAACIAASLSVKAALAAVDGPGANQHTEEASEPSRFLDQAATRIIGLTNNFRRDQGEPQLSTNETLVDTARDFAAFMARTGRYGHQADGQTPAERAREHGYEICLIAENIGWQLVPTDTKTEALAAAFVDGWKDSPGHRDNMLTSAARDIGVAVAESRQSGRFYAVQLFGRPGSMDIEFTITNDAEVSVAYTLGDRDYRLPSRLRRTHQICRPSALRIQWPNDQERTSVTPEDGQQFRIERGAAGQLDLRQQ